MRRFLERVFVLALALGVTLAVFLFWGKLGNAFRTAMEVVYADPKPVTPPPANPGEVTVKIIGPDSAQPPCPKDRQHRKCI